MLSFLRDERGTATIEHVLWLPVTLSFLMFTADVTMVFFRQQQLHDLARDASRQVALGRFSDDEAKEEMLSRLSDGPDYGASVQTSNGYVSSSISVPLRNITIFSDVFSGDQRLSASVTMWVESTDTP